MERRPFIGVSGSHNAEDRQFFVRVNYMESVLRAGGIPVLLPEVADEKTAGEMLTHLDGLLLAGGDDVSPAYYGEETLPECGNVDPMRDTFEMLITPMAIKMNMPIMGICRGIQMLAVAMGGTLIQDIESQLSIPREHHQQKPPFSKPVHGVVYTAGGLFDRLTGGTRMAVNSMHHQAIKDPGEHLVVEGRAEDGVIEAVTCRDSDRIFAVQYHPEYLADHDEKCQKLFDHFVALSGQYQKENGR